MCELALNMADIRQVIEARKVTCPFKPSARTAVSAAEVHSCAGCNTPLAFNRIYITTGKGKGHPLTGHQGPRGGVEV
jgi:hypothetical protein